MPWLLVVARNTLANQRRTFARHDRVQLETSALERLASTDLPVDDLHVSAKSTHDSRGRSALEVDFIDQSIRPGEVQSIYFDPKTSSVLEERITDPGETFISAYDGWSTVGAVPADVLAKAVTGGDKPQTEPPAPPIPCTWDKSPAPNASDSAAPHK